MIFSITEAAICLLFLLVAIILAVSYFKDIKAGFEKVPTIFRNLFIAGLVVGMAVINFISSIRSLILLIVGQ